MVIFKSVKIRMLTQKSLCYVRIIGVLLFALMSTHSYAEKKISCVDEHNIKPYFSTYKIIDLARYGGGLTTEKSAKENIGKKMVVSENLFKIKNDSIINPVYKLACYSYPKDLEGDVPQYRWSNFYGFGMDREIIMVLEVYDLKRDTKYPEYSLELIGNNEIWRMSDGWLYKMKRTPD